MQQSRGGPAHLSWLNQHRFDEHVRPINAYVEVLAKTFGQFVPYVSPQYGGTHARLLAIHRSPGVKTDPAQGGSGYLDYENSDTAARRHRDFLEGAGIDVGDVLSWNAMPWIDPDFSNERQVASAEKVLEQLIGLLERPVVVMLHGREASDMWPRFGRNFPSAARRLHPIKTLSLGWGLINHKEKSQQEVDAVNIRLADDFGEAARLLERCSQP